MILEYIIVTLIFQIFIHFATFETKFPTFHSLCNLPKFVKCFMKIYYYEK